VRVALELFQRHGVQRKQLVLQLRRVHLPQGEVIGLHHLGKQSACPFAQLNRAVLSTKIIAELVP
jgi:hypothetical protein